MKLNITYIVSDINKSLAFEWIVSNINREKFNLNFILLNKNNSELESFLIANDIVFKRINYHGARNKFAAINEVRIFLKRQNSHIVHAHLMFANIIGLLSAWLAGVKKRIYTRHHSNFHLIYHPKAVKYDRLSNTLATHIIAISENVKRTLMQYENVPENKIRLIHHGFKLEDFSDVPESSIRLLSKKYNPLNMSPVIGVISRYTEWKGIQYIIPAFKKLLNVYPDAFLILANSVGDYEHEINRLLIEIPVKNYIQIPFESDIFALYKIFDLFVHTPISDELEAFGQIYVEALAAEVPSIFTISGIAGEFIKPGQNALTVPYKNSEEITVALKKLIENSQLRNQLKKNGKMDVYSKFNLSTMISSLENLYEE